MELILIVLVVLFLVGGGGYYGHRTWGPTGGFGIGGLLLLVFVIWLLFFSGHRI